MLHLWTHYVFYVFNMFGNAIYFLGDELLWRNTDRTDILHNVLNGIILWNMHFIVNFLLITC